MSSEVQKARKRGKNLEYEVAKRLNGEVVGHSKAVELKDGRHVKVDPQHLPDVLSVFNLSVECKNRKDLPKGVVNPMDQAKRNAPQGFKPIAWWYNSPDRTHYVIMESGTLEALLERLEWGRMEKDKNARSR